MKAEGVLMAFRGMGELARTPPKRKELAVTTGISDNVVQIQHDGMPRRSCICTKNGLSKSAVPDEVST